MFDGNTVKNTAESDVLVPTDNKEVMLSACYSTSASLSFPYMGDWFLPLLVPVRTF